MDIKLNLQHPDEMEAFAAFLTASAESRRKRPTAPLELYGLDRAASGLWSGPLDYGTSDAETDEERVTREAEDLIPTTDGPAAGEEKPKRTRRTKAEIEAAAKATETVANLDPTLVAEAKAAGISVQGPAATEDEPELPMGQEEVEEPIEQVEEVKMTENDVRNAIIDLLNEAQAKFPDDADVRTKTLAPILKALGAEKISKIAMTEYPRVPGILAKARADMDAALAEAA